MSDEDEYQPPAPNLVSITKMFKFSLPKSPTTLPIWNPASPKLTSKDQTYSLWGKEFKFSFEVTPNSPPKLELVNKSSGPIWIYPIDLYNGIPQKVSPNEKIPFARWNRKFKSRKRQIDVKGSFTIAMGIDYDPEPLLQQDLLNLLREKKLTDFKLKCGEEEFPCHKSVMAARSSVLADAFTYSSEDDQHEIKGFAPTALKKLLDVLYYGTITVNVDNEVRKLADYLDIKLLQEQVPELKPLYEIPVPGNLQTLKEWCEFRLWLNHKIQIEPSFAAKNVEMTWTIPNFGAWREDQLANHIEQLPEKRTTFLDKEFVFECHLRLDENTQNAFLVNKSEGLAFVKNGAHSQLVVFQPNSFQHGWNSCKRLGDDLVMKFNITLLMFLDNDNKAKLQKDFLGLFIRNKFTDFKLSCGGEELPCHKAILAARLPAFAQIFEDDPKADHHEIEGFLPAKVKQMLEFIYSETVNGEADLELLQLANRFRIKGLVKLCGRSIAKTVTLANALDLLDVADSQPDGALKNLEDSVLDFCANNYWELRRSDQWKNRVPKSPVAKICDFSFHTRSKFF